MAETGESHETASQGLKENKCLPAFYVLGLLKRAVFIDLAQIDQSFARGLTHVLLSIKLVYLYFFLIALVFGDV